MAERRMFAKTIIDSDAFLDMPLSTQALYFHLSMRADDEGFVNNPKKIQRMIGASDDDMKVLNAKRFVLTFESGVIVIKHWKIHNYIRGDRLQETAYQAERALLEVKDNGAYTFNKSLAQIECQTSDSHVSVDCQSNVSIGKDRIGKDSIGKDKESTHAKKKYGQYHHVLLTDDEFKKLHDDFGTRADEAITFLDEYVEMKGAKYKSHYLAIRRWVIDAVKEREKKTGISKSAAAYNSYQQRDYSQRDMDDIERRLLDKSRAKAQRGDA